MNDLGVPLFQETHHNHVGIAMIDKAPMTGNGEHTNYDNYDDLGDGLFLLYPQIPSW